MRVFKAGDDAKLVQLVATSPLGILVQARTGIDVKKILQHCTLVIPGKYTTYLGWAFSFVPPCILPHPSQFFDIQMILKSAWLWSSHKNKVVSGIYTGVSQEIILYLEAEGNRQQKVNAAREKRPRIPALVTWIEEVFKSDPRDPKRIPTKELWASLPESSDQNEGFFRDGDQIFSESDPTKSIKKRAFYNLVAMVRKKIASNGVTCNGP